MEGRIDETDDYIYVPVLTAWYLGLQVVEHEGTALMLRIQLLGTGNATFNGQQIHGFAHTQPLLLLCYLILHRSHAVHRERVASTFWVNGTNHTMRKQLRNALWRIREAFAQVGACLDDYLHISEDTIQFIPACPHWLDIEVFETVCLRCKHNSGLTFTAHQAKELAHTVSLYNGSLLEPVYADWCLHDRERYRIMYLEALERLMLYHASQREFEDAITYGLQILEHDSVREHIHRQLMRLFWLQGDRNGALMQYDKCVRILRNEMGIPPMIETRTLHQEILTHQCNSLTWFSNPAMVHDEKSRMSDHTLLAKEAAERLNQLHALVDQANCQISELEGLIENLLNAQVV